MQTRKQSFIESCINITIGYITALVSQIIIFPIFDIDVPLSDNLLIGAYFTIISLIRSYLVRRYFNRYKSVKRKDLNKTDKVEDK